MKKEEDKKNDDKNDEKIEVSNKVENKTEIIEKEEDKNNDNKKENIEENEKDDKNVIKKLKENKEEKKENINNNLINISNKNIIKLENSKNNISNREFDTNSSQLIKNQDISNNIKEKKENISKKENELNIIKQKISLKQNSIYQGMEFKQNLKTYSPICDKCFRLVYISFDYIKNYISTYCIYCRNLSVYKYDTFLEKIKEIENPLLNCYCNKCNKSFIFSDEKNPFYLIETEENNFIIICEKCDKSKCNKKK